MRRLLSVLSFSILITACGGGGGGGNNNNDETNNGGDNGGGENTLLITTNNAQDVSSKVLSTVDSTITIGSSLATVQSTNSSINKFNIERFLRNQLKLINPVISKSTTHSNVLPNATQTETISCTQGGSLAITFNDNDNNSTITAGDTIIVMYQDCKEEDILFNGQQTTQILLTEGDWENQTAPYHFRENSTFDNLNFASNGDSLTINGDMTIDLNNQDGINAFTNLSGANLTWTSTGSEPDSVTLSNYTFNSTNNLNTSQYSVTSNGHLDSSTIGGSVSFNTTQDFQGVGDQNPNTGIMLIGGANGSKATVRVIDNINVAIDVDSNGDSTNEQTITTTWSALLQNI